MDSLPSSAARRQRGRPNGGGTWGGFIRGQASLAALCAPRGHRGLQSGLGKDPSTGMKGSWQGDKHWAGEPRRSRLCSSQVLPRTDTAAGSSQSPTAARGPQAEESASEVRGTVRRLVGGGLRSLPVNPVFVSGTGPSSASPEPTRLAGWPGGLRDHPRAHGRPHRLCFSPR